MMHRRRRMVRRFRSVIELIALNVVERQSVSFVAVAVIFVNHLRHRLFRFQLSIVVVSIVVVVRVILVADLR